MVVALNKFPEYILDFFTNINVMGFIKIFSHNFLLVLTDRYVIDWRG